MFNVLQFLRFTNYNKCFIYKGQLKSYNSNQVTVGQQFNESGKYACYGDCTMSTLITNTLQGINTIKYDASTTALNINSSGTVTSPKMVAFSCTLNADHTHTTSSPTNKVTGWTVRTNNGTGHQINSTTNFWIIYIEIQDFVAKFMDYIVITTQITIEH